MVYTLLSWIVIGISAFLWGFGILSVLGRVNDYRDKALDLVLMTGLCALTVYAQTFSLFYRVGMEAVAGVLLLNALCVVFKCREIIKWMKEIRAVAPLRLMLAGGIGLLILITVSGMPAAYDVYLYHAQDIRWIEEYGAVPGLGNLHSRLAYNSSFHSLQALFSFSFLLGQSMHSMNGFIMWVMLSYAACGIKFRWNGKIYASDFTRMAIVCYCSVMMIHVISPVTDFSAMCLILYIACKWCDLSDEAEDKMAPYAYLSILGIWAVSLKLSGIMIILLAIMPAYKLISGKKWKEIVLYTGLGILAIAPFLIRNVILSGYLIYPYPEIDFFSFDWKMPIGKAAFEQLEIKAYAQGYRGPYPTDPALAEWFPLWRDTQLLTDYKMLLEFIMDTVSVPIALMAGVVEGIKRKNWHLLHMAGCLAAGILFWFFNAPSRRFGEAWLILLPLYLAGNILEKLDKKFRLRAVATAAIAATVLLFAAAGAYGLRYSVINGARGIHGRLQWLIVPADYTEVECQITEIDGLTVYYPLPASDQSSYHDFPATPHLGNLSGIELRGKSFAEGFRPK